MTLNTATKTLGSNSQIPILKLKEVDHCQILLETEVTCIKKKNTVNWQGCRLCKAGRKMLIGKYIQSNIHNQVPGTGTSVLSFDWKLWGICGVCLPYWENCPILREMENGRAKILDVTAWQTGIANRLNFVVDKVVKNAIVQYMANNKLYSSIEWQLWESWITSTSVRSNTGN